MRDERSLLAVIPIARSRVRPARLGARGRAPALRSPLPRRRWAQVRAVRRRLCVPPMRVLRPGGCSTGTGSPCRLMAVVPDGLERCPTQGRLTYRGRSPSAASSRGCLGRCRHTPFNAPYAKATASQFWIGSSTKTSREVRRGHRRTLCRLRGTFRWLAQSSTNISPPSRISFGSCSPRRSSGRYTVSVRVQV